MVFGSVVAGRISGHHEIRSELNALIPWLKAACKTLTLDSSVRINRFKKWLQRGQQHCLFRNDNLLLGFKVKMKCKSHDMFTGSARLGLARIDVFKYRHSTIWNKFNAHRREQTPAFILQSLFVVLLIFFSLFFRRFVFVVGVWSNRKKIERWYTQHWTVYLHNIKTKRQNYPLLDLKEAEEKMAWQKKIRERWRLNCVCVCIA